MKYIVSLVFLSVYLFASMDGDSKYQTCDIDSIENPETKSSMKKWLKSSFGLKPYRVNYLLPLGYRQDNYESKIPTDEYINIEAELQISLKLNVGNDLFGLGEMYYISYTQKSFWQVYAKSSPFRESDYNPELFVIFPFNRSFLGTDLRAIKFAYAHKSNGEGNIEEVSPDKAEKSGVENTSRSINYLYTELRFQHKSFMADLKLWAPIPENEDTNDNEDIMDYTGYSSLKLTYFLGQNMFTLMGRGNIAKKHGAGEFTYSYPMLEDVYFYTKIFTGYGESMIDYNTNLTKYSVGFSFSR